jgi:hypothetical protein
MIDSITERGYVFFSTFFVSLQELTDLIDTRSTEALIGRTKEHALVTTSPHWCRYCLLQGQAEQVDNTR